IEAGINRDLNHVRRQKPPLFNYGSEAVRADESLLCSPIDVHPVVRDPARAPFNPVVTVEPDLPAVPILGSVSMLLTFVSTEPMYASTLGLSRPSMLPVRMPPSIQ